MSRFGMAHYPQPARARELTPEEVQQRQEDMHRLNESIKGALAEGRRALWKLAAFLDKFDEEVGWSALGYDSQNHWLADPEISMSRSRFHRLVDTYRFLVKHGVTTSTMVELDLSKVDVALPAVRQGRANLDDAIDDVKMLGARDLREKYRDPAAETKKTGPNVGTTPAPPPPNPVDDTPVRASDGQPLGDAAPPIQVSRGYDEPLEEPGVDETRWASQREENAASKAPPPEAPGHEGTASDAARVCESCGQPIPGTGPA